MSGEIRPLDADAAGQVKVGPGTQSPARAGDELPTRPAYVAGAGLGSLGPDHDFLDRVCGEMLRLIWRRSNDYEDSEAKRALLLEASTVLEQIAKAIHP